MSDVSFNVETSNFKAHKVILSARSTFFKLMFESGLKESLERHITINDLSSQTFQMILEFIYTGDVKDIKEDYVIELLTYSYIYELKGLQLIMESLVGFSLDTDNAGCILELAYTYKCPKLLSALYYFTINNWSGVKTTQGWRTLSNEIKDSVYAKAEEMEIKLK